MADLNIGSYFHKWLFAPRLNSLQKPVFIVGCGHSGTSILLRIIASHSKFHAIEDESRLFYKSNRQITKTLKHWSQLLNDNNKKRVIEKTPEHIFCIENIIKKIHDVKIICMVRDGRDVACSHKQRTSFESGLDNWIRSTMAIEPYLNHPNIMIVKLEDFVSNPTEIIKEILGFLGESFEEDMLDYHKYPAYYYDSRIEKPLKAEDGNNHRALRNWQINQPLFKTTTRWKVELSENEKKLFKQKAQVYLSFWGYDNYEEW